MEVIMDNKHTDDFENFSKNQVTKVAYLIGVPEYIQFQ